MRRCRTFAHDFTTFFTGLAIPVASGEQLAIVLANFGHNGQNIFWNIDPAAGYAGGAPFAQPRDNPQDITGRNANQGNVAGPWQRSCCPDFDFGFSTLVEAAAAPTPEPATLLLLGTGVVWTVGRYRRLNTASSVVSRTRTHMPRWWIRTVS